MHMQFNAKKIPNLWTITKKMFLGKSGVVAQNIIPYSNINRNSKAQEPQKISTAIKNKKTNNDVVPLSLEKRKKLLSFFGMQSNPFIDIVDPAIYFNSPKHEGAFNKLLHSIEDGISMGLLTAPSGMGKTLIIQKIKQSLSVEDYSIINIKMEKGLARTGLLRKILFCLGSKKIYMGQQVKVNDLLSLLSNKVHENYEKNGKRLVLLIDDAETLSLELLYLLKTISNIEIPQVKLVSIILFGEDSLFKRLSLKTFKSIAGRMFIKESIKPLTLTEMKKYIKYKLKQVNCKQDLFSNDVYEVIHVASGGICREINNLIYNALIESFYMQKRMIDNKVILKCLK
ncbi:MAG: AAA family ATPase [Candidatus Margulisiibacteriota bacterium]